MYSTVLEEGTTSMVVSGTTGLLVSVVLVFGGSGVLVVSVSGQIVVTTVSTPCILVVYVVLDTLEVSGVLVVSVSQGMNEVRVTNLLLTVLTIFEAMYLEVTGLHLSLSQVVVVKVTVDGAAFDSVVVSHGMNEVKVTKLPLTVETTSVEINSPVTTEHLSSLHEVVVKVTVDCSVTGTVVA